MSSTSNEKLKETTKYFKKKKMFSALAKRYKDKSSLESKKSGGADALPPAPSPSRNAGLVQTESGKTRSKKKTLPEPKKKTLKPAGIKKTFEKLSPDKHDVQIQKEQKQELQPPKEDYTDKDITNKPDMYKTIIDQIYEYVQKNEIVDTKELSFQSDIPHHQLEEWAKRLADEGLIEIRYPLFGGIKMVKNGISDHKSKKGIKVFLIIVLVLLFIFIVLLIILFYRGYL